jgi:hypothetical protein
VRDPEPRTQAHTNLLDLSALHFGLGANYVGSLENSVPKKLGLVPRLISNQLVLSLRHFRSASGRGQTVHRESLAARQDSRDRQSLLRACRHPAQCGTGMLGNPVQRHKTSMLIFAIQPKREYSEGDPVSSFIRVHGVLTVWTLDVRCKERSTEQSVLLRTPQIPVETWLAPSHSAAEDAASRVSTLVIVA